MSKVLIGSKVEKLTFQLFQILLISPPNILLVEKHLEYYEIKNRNVHILFEQQVITIKTDKWSISSDMRYKDGEEDEVDFQSELVKYMFENLKHLMLYNDKIVVTQTGFICYEADKISLKAIS